MELKKGYKQTEIGVIPEDWEVKKLGSLGKTISGLSGKTKADFGNGNARYITFMNVMSNVVIDTSILEKVNVRQGETQNTFKKGDLFFNTSSETPEEVGMCAVLLDNIQDVYLNSFCFGYRLSTEELNGLYLSYLINSNIGRSIFESLAQGATRYNLSKTNFNNVTINIPSTLEEQQAIAQVLSDTDQLFQNLKNLIDKKKAIRTATERILFSPKSDWSKYKISEIAVYRRGSFPQPYGLTKWYDEINGKPFVQVVDVGFDFKLKSDTKSHISKMAESYSVFVKKGSIILTIQGSIGRICITQYDAFVDRTLLIFESFKKKIDKYFFMISIYRKFQEEKEKAPGGTIKTITKEALSEFEVYLPPIQEQQSIAQILSDMDAEIEALEQQLQKTQALKQGMMQELLTGKTRLIHNS